LTILHCQRKWQRVDLLQRALIEMRVDVEVRDLKHLTNIIAALRVDPAIASVERVRG